MSAVTGGNNNRETERQTKQTDGKWPKRSGEKSAKKLSTGKQSTSIQQNLLIAKHTI